MPYQITLPDGSIGMIDDSVPKDRAMEAAEAAYPDAFPGIGEQLLGAPAEFAKAFVRQGLIDPVSGGLSGVYTGLRAAGMELDPFSETSVGKGLASAQEYLAPGYGTVSQFVGGLGGLTSLLVPGTLMAKGLARTATLGGMATGLGAEEARGRVEEARAEGIEVTPGQEFTSQLGGGVIGIGDLAPIERLTKPLQAVLRGVKKSDAEMIAPGLFNSAKRMVQTGGIEGLQEGMANVAQDLLAKGIYNPNLEVGDSALGDAAMGASVGAFAQGAIELVTRGRRKSLYESLKTEEEQKTRDAEAEKARLAKETARKQTLTNFGVEGQPLLLAAPQGQITPSRQEKSSLDQYGVEDKDLFEPYGTFTRDELDKDVVKELDKRRDEAGRPKTETFTLQDIADTGVYRGELNRLIAQRSGYTGETKFKPSEVVGLAEQKNIDTSTQGFSDFVGRVTGKKPLPEKTGLKALQGLNDVEIFAVREAINKLPTYEQRKILPAGKAAKIFDDKQATRTLTNIKKTLGQDLGEKGLGETSVLKEIGDFSGLKDVNDQQSLLEKYILDGELERVSTPAFAVLDADGKQISVVGPDAGGRLTDIERRKAQEKAEKTLKPGFAVLDAKGKQVDVDVDQGKAQQKAARIGGTIQETTISGSVKDTTINQIRTPDPINRLIGGFDIRQGTFEDTLIDGYDITTETGEVISKTKSLTDAENRVNRATELRKQRQLQLLDAKQKIQENIAKSEQAMADLEALGKKDSEDFKKIQNSMAAQERNLAKVEQNLIEFGKKVAFKSRYKQQKRTGFTLFEGNKPVGTYNSRQEALEASVVSQPTDRLEAMLEAFPTLSASAKPGMDRADIKKLQQVAASELASRKGEIPSGVGITVEGDITAAEDRLALQGIFSPRIKERVNELDKKLRAALDKLGLKDVRLNIVGAIKGELGDADGVYAARLIKIALDAENPMRVLRHEGIHALKELGAFTPDQWRVLENKAKSEWMAKYNIADPKRYGSLSPEIQLEEAIAEAFADFSQTKPPAGLIGNVFSRIKSFFAALDNGFKGLGFQTADDVFGRVERGELLPGMGERAAEVQGLQAQRVVAETPERYSLKRVAPSKVVSSVIEDLGLSDAEVAATSLGLQTGKGGTDAFKQANIGGIKQIIEYLEKRYADSGLAPLDITNEQDRDTLSKLLAAEVLAAVRSGGANIQWYDKVIDQMLGMASLKYPELRTDPNAQAAFRIAISVTSQGQNVEDNLKFGERVYEQFSQNAERGRPRFPEIGTGESMQAMQKNFQLANKMIDKLGMDDFRKFLETPFTVKELNSVGLKIGGELVDEQVLGSSILGPKIGFGFYSNLSGNFEPVTMDMWFMRTIGRLIGKLRGFDPAKYAKQVQRFRGSFALSNESGVNGIYANEFSQEEINNAIVDEQAMIDLARKVKSKHERDFSKNRDLYDSKQRAKTDFVKSAETIIQSLDKPKDVPASGGERRLLRDVVRRMRQKVADVTGQDIPPASLQAIVWYPEQELYKALGAKLRVTSQNYANSMRKLLEGEGFDGDRISESAKLGSRRTRRADAGEIPAGTRPTGRRPSRTLSAKEREDLLKQRFSLREPAKVIYEVAPDPNNVELTERWNALPTEQKTEISKRVGARIVEAALPILKARGRVADQVGSYLDFTNPSFALVLEDGDPIEMSKLLGFALSQDSMMVVSGDSAPGLEQTGGIVINIGDLSFDQVDAIYQQLREIEVNGQKPVGGQTTVDGKMIVLNYSGLPSSDLAQLIDQQLNGQFRVGVGDFFTAFPEKGDYDYASVSNDPAGSAGLIRKRSRDLRTEASRLLNDEINAVPRDGKYSLRGTNTPQFREWFGQSKIVDAEGRPRVMYHGTARDITEFKAKQAGAIFVTEDPRFAEDFGIQSETWMIDHADQFLPEQELKKAIALGVTKMTPGMSKQKRTEMLAEMLKFPTMSIIRDPDATKIRDVVLNKMPSRQNILPVYVRSENPFDYQNPEDVQGVIDYIEENVLFSEIYEAFNRDLDITDDLRSELESGRWASIENPIVQEAIRENRHDGFYIREGGRKNLAVYDPNQLKSVTGNIGTYGQREPSLEEAKQFGLTVEEAKAAQKRGDIRYSLRNTNTPEFKQWFRKSPVVNAVDKPQMMFHGTSLDIEEFIPGKTGAIYVSPDPEFAGTFARYSQEREIRKLGENLDQDLEAKQRILDPIIDEAMANGDLINRNLPYHRDLAQVGLIKDLDQYSKEYWMNWFLEKPMRDAAHSTGVGPALREALANMLTTGRNVMPLYVNPQKPFDYENNAHVNKVAKLVFEYDPDTYERVNPKVQKYQRDTLVGGLKAGDWRVLEEPIVQEAIKELGFDAFYVKEQDVKNLGLYTPNQLKSAIGNTGAFSPETGKVRYSLRQTNTPAFKQWFGDSKVAGSDGKPTVVYTGTSKDVDFSTFKIPKSGVWFTESQEGASQYALENDSMTIKTEDYRTFQEINTASRVIPAYLRIDNPAKLSKEESDSIRYAKNYRKAQGDLFDRLRSRGHDGVEIGDGTWVVLKSPNQIKSAIGNTGEFSSVKSDIRYSLRQQAGQTLGQSYLNTVQRTTTPRVEKGFKDRISEAMSATPFAKFRQMFINKYERIEYFSKQLAKQFGDAVLLADQSAIAAALMSDRAAGVAAESFKSGIPVYAKGYTYVDNMGGKVKGLMEILMPLAQKQDPFVYQMYQDYAARRRGVRLDSEGKITPFTRQELSEIPNIEKAFPEFKQVFEDYQRYNEGLVRYMRDTGVIDAKAAQEWMRYGDYVPFYRQLEGESTVGPSIFSAISGVKAPKKLKGGDAPLGEFLETVVRNSRAAIEAGMRNVAANRVVNNFQRLNSPSTGGRLVEKTSEQNKNRPDVVTVRENGKDAYYKVADPLLVQSLQALNIPQIPGLDILAKPAEFLREMVTRDPAFIGASVLRESLSAWITTGQKLTPVASGVNQFVKILANASPTVQALRRAGIGSGYEFKGDVQATAGEFGRQLKEKAGEMTTAQKAVMPLRAMWDSLDKASTAADLSTRAAVFERVMQETGNEAEAIYQAMEVINFSRKGSSPIIQIFAAIIPFLNARIQGLDLLYRAGFGELASATKVAQQKAFMLRSLALLGTTAMYYALVQDEEEWQRADQETRDNYWIIGNMKFPIPFELGVMFKVLPERIMAYTMGEDTGEQVRASIARQVLGTLSFNPIPQAVLPLIEASSNYSFFLQRDIVGMGKKDLAPEFQTSEGTSQIAIQLGQTLGISPMKIDYVIRGYTGAMGTYAISTMDSIIRSEDDATKATWRLDQIPVLKRFMISDLGAGTVNEYYDLREKLDEVVRTSNQLERTGNIEALQDYLKDNGQVLGMKDYIRSLDKDMKSLRESRMAINMSRMEPDQKREALDSLRRAEISLTERIGLLRSNLGV
jgi:hypothetical protein